MSQGIVNISDASFEAEVLKAEGPVLVDYWAEWCGPCKIIAPVLAEIAATNAKLDALGLVLDSDPRRVTKTGSAQTSDPASDPAAGPEDDPAQPNAAQQD